MNRKQRERANAKYNAGLEKRLRNSDMDEWDSILHEALHHIVKINLQPEVQHEH